MLVILLVRIFVGSGSTFNRLLCMYVTPKGASFVALGQTINF